VKEKNGLESVVQKLNRHVFPHWDRIENNVTLIQQILESANHSLLVPQFFRVNGSIHQQKDEQIWRRMEFISEETISKNATNSEKAYRASKGFSQFSRILSPSLKINDWQEVIPNFHDLYLRFFQFQTALKSAKKERIEQAEKTLMGYQRGMKQMLGIIPEVKNNRITHNDAKINNVIFRNLSNLAIIDLDTVMPGNVLYDLGDMVRTFVPQKPEGDFSTSRQMVQVDCLEALLAGYQEGWEDELSKDEKRNLPFAGAYMTLLIGLRFLTDFLENDHYFKVDFETQNLLRANNQLELFELLA
jgi:thiamine kinase-like enzyme